MLTATELPKVFFIRQFTPFPKGAQRFDRNGIGAPAAEPRAADDRHTAAVRLFVVQHLGQHFFTVVAAAQRQADAAVVHRARAFAAPGLDHGQHAERNALAVVKAGFAPSLHALHGFDAVAEGVAEVQRFVRAVLALVLFDDIFLHHQAAVDDGLDVRVDIARLKNGEQRGVKRQPLLDGLGQPVDVLAAGQWRGCPGRLQRASAARTRR